MWFQRCHLHTRTYIHVLWEKLWFQQIFEDVFHAAMIVSSIFANLDVHGDKYAVLVLVIFVMSHFW